MVMNIKGHVDRRRYNPSRDLAYAWPNLSQVMLDGLRDGRREPITESLVRAHGLTEGELGEAAYCYSKFFEYCQKPAEPTDNSPPVRRVEDALRLSGFFDLPLAAQAVVLVRLGQVATGAFFHAIRDVTVDGEDNPLNDRDVVSAGRQALEAFLARGRRWYHRLLFWKRRPA
jgi:hypothetical protein